MPTSGYSDRLNHALAFAAKHHDSQVRKGLRAPYGTQPANVALILTRYGQDDATVLAGILHDLVATYVLEAGQSDPVLERIEAKFGREVLETALAVAPRQADDAGVELDSEERRADLLRRLDAAPERARWVLAAVQLHQAGTLLADLTRTSFPEAVWDRQQAGREGTIARYRAMVTRLRDVGFDAPIVAELEQIVEQIEAHAALV